GQGGLTGGVDFVLGTFGKAFGGYGAFVAGSRAAVDYLVNQARSLVFSTALPPPVVAAALAALEVAAAEPERRRRLADLARGFREAVGRRTGLSCPGEDQIVPVVIGESGRAVEISRRLEVEGFLVRAVRPPTVPAGAARLRVSVTAGHDPADLRRLAEALADAL
ncbi:aminotransferase class I/II-fold pyridoxal phosphate-dependent enzyme, partial [Dissulfurirhabdus thermomarina]